MGPAGVIQIGCERRIFHDAPQFAPLTQHIFIEFFGIGYSLGNGSVFQE